MDKPENYINIIEQSLIESGIDFKSLSAHELSLVTKAIDAAYNAGVEVSFKLIEDAKN